MSAECEALRILNIDIGRAEDEGDKPFFERLLTPAFAIRRADGKHIDSREKFISNVTKSGPRLTEVGPITLFPTNRALVVCTVTMSLAGVEKRFHNLRLFSRESADDPWRLLAWANEPTPAPANEV